MWIIAGTIPDPDFSLLVPVLPLAAVVATVVSVKVSMRNYEKRER